MILQAEAWSDVKCSTRLDSQGREIEQTIKTAKTGRSEKVFFLRDSGIVFPLSFTTDVNPSHSTSSEKAIKQVAVEINQNHGNDSHKT